MNMLTVPQPRRLSSPCRRAWLALVSLMLSGMAWAQPLVDPAWLKARVGQPGWVLLDASPMPIHRAGHIPGAINADLMFSGTGLPTQAQMQSRLTAWGIGPDSRIVIYDNQDTMWATRVAFDLHRHGVPLERLHVLDGGLKAWRAAGGAVSQDSRPAPVAGTAQATPARAGMTVALPEVLGATGRADPRRLGGPGEVALIEALEPAWYFGQRHFFGRGGHLPHAQMWSARDLLQEDGRFKPLPELRRMASLLGLDAQTPVITYCGGGVAATLPWFVLQVLMGWPQVSVYVGSQREWVRDARGLPMWTWAEPQRLRSADWLAVWNDDILRMTGSARLGVIDVRPTAQMRQGHIPHAHPLAAERWPELRRDPAALRATLAASGLDPAHEIVLVGQGGIDPTAALAWATLEDLGHRHVALLMESTDEWALRGHPLNKPAAAPAAGSPTANRPHAGWLSLAPPATPALNGRSDPGVPRQILRADSRYSGPSLPPGTVQLPWTELVQADRSPRPPHEIHGRLTQAGLSRWAHVEVQAADPAEAAAALLLLRLVGWPSATLARP